MEKNSLSEQVSVSKYEVQKEWLILSHCIMIDDLLDFVYLKFKKGVFQRSFLNEYNQFIFDLLIDYWEKYRKAPKINIQALFDEKKQIIDEDKASVLESYLDRFAEEYSLVNSTEINIDFFKKEVIPSYIERQQLQGLIQKINLGDDKNDYEFIKKQIKEFQNLSDSKEEDEELGTITPGNLKTARLHYSPDRLAHRNLFSMPGDLGRLIGPFYRGGMFAITGTEKGGKTQVMSEIGYQGLIFNKLKVLDISLEMPGEDKVERFYQRIGYFSADKHDSGEQLQPIFDCENNQFGTCKVLKKKLNQKVLLRSENDEVEFWERMDWIPCSLCRKKKYSENLKRIPRDKRFIPAIWYKLVNIKLKNLYRTEKALKRLRFYNIQNYRIKSFPRFSATFDDIKSYAVDYIKLTKFKPDLLIIDYPDIMSPVEGKINDRTNIDYNWMQCSRLAEELDVALIIADQTKRDARSAQSINRSDTSEDKRKDAHLNLRITLNKTDTEEILGLQRVGTLFKRKGKLYQFQVMCLQNLSICNPLLDSEIWPHKYLHYPTVKQKFD